MRTSLHLRTPALALVGLLFLSQITASLAAPAVMAIVNGQPISSLEYQYALQTEFRNKYYHGQPPEAELKAVRAQVLTDLITGYLLASEAARRGLKPDQQAVEKDVIKRLSQTRVGSDETLVTIVRKHATMENLSARLRSQVTRDVAEPDTDAAREYYSANLEKFVEPAVERVSVILLRVQPFAPKAAWDNTRERALQLVAEIRGGQSFAALAKAHSQHETAAGGGDLGYLHKGMLSEDAQKAVDKLGIGEVTEPVFLLEGFGIFRLADRVEPKQRDFDDVQERAAALLAQELQDKAWNDLKSRLVEAAEITRATAE